MPIPKPYRNDKDAPWNQPPPPACPECRNEIRDVADHDEWCPCDMDSDELHEFWAEERQHIEYDPLEHGD